MTLSNARIIFHFDVHQPIELMELTLAFNALAINYRRFLMTRARDQANKINEDDVKLYITKIENNCILAELAGASQIIGVLMPIMDYANIFSDFVNNIKKSIDYFKNLGMAGVPPQAADIPYSKSACGNMAAFLGVVAKNTGGSLKMEAAEYKDEQKQLYVSFKFSDTEALSAQKGALIAERALELRTQADYPDVLMYFHQTNIEEPKMDGRTGDKAVIPVISSKPLPVYFVSTLDNERIKSFINDPELNPFKVSYRVDANVEKNRNGVPCFYRIVKLHDIIPD